MKKWTAPQPDLTKGAIVLVVEECQSFKWPLGRILEVFPGPDGRVRVVDVFVRGSVKCRAISKIVHLFNP